MWMRMQQQLWMWIRRRIRWWKLLLHMDRTYNHSSLLLLLLINSTYNNT